MAEASNQRRSRQHAARKMTPRSRVWEHFVRFADGGGRDKARCKRCALELGADTRNGTSTLWAHVRICKGPRDGPPAGSSPPQPMMLEHFEEGGGGNGDELARMIAFHGYDPSFVDDGYFRRFVRSLNPEFDLPTREVIEEMCDGIFDEARRGIFSRIRNAPGRVSLAVGTVWTNEGAVSYSACHFIDDEWILHRVIMDVYMDGCYPDCHGPLMGVYQTPLFPDFRDTSSIEKVMDDFSRRGVLDNLFMVVWEIIGRSGADNRLQLRNVIEKRKYNTNPSMTQLITTSYVDNVFRLIGTCLFLDEEFDGDMTSDLEDLDLTRQTRQKLLSQIGVDYNLLAYDNYWYSSYCSLEVIRKEGSTLTDTGSEFAELFCKLCGEMYHAIQRISTASRPTSNICLVELFKLREIFQSGVVQASGDNAIAYKSCNGFLDCDQGKDVADVLREAMDNLDKSIKDSYLVWSIPLILDPRYKLEYIEFIFRRAYTQSEATNYISEVRRQIKKLYVDYFEYGAETSCANSDLVTVMIVGSSTYPLQQAWDEHCQLRDSMCMSTEVTPSYQDAEMELDRYLKDRLAPQTQSFDILKWWKDNNWNYPTVARMAMARDALAMPTCSKLSSEQMAHVRSILRGYSKAAFGDLP